MTTFDRSLKISSRTSLRTLVAAALAAVMLIVAGCGGDVQQDEAGLSYADLVVTYNGELAALDRLEQKKETLIQKIEAIGLPTSEDALKLLDKVLASGLTSGDEEAANTKVNEAADPYAALDRAVQRAQDVQDAARDLLGSIGKQSANTPEQTAENERIKNELSRELEALEKEIATQRQRVERARQARDAAEVASP